MNAVKSAIVDGEPTRWTWDLDPDEVKEIFNTLRKRQSGDIATMKK